MGSVTIMELQLLTVTAPVGWAGTRIIPGADCLMNNYQEPGPGAIISGSGAGDKKGVSAGKCLNGVFSSPGIVRALIWLVTPGHYRHPSDLVLSPFFNIR